MNRPARTDAVVTARLKAAGAVLVGKTNLHEFAFGTTSEDTAFGAVRNPSRHFAVGRRLEWRVGRIGCDRHVDRNGRHRHRRIDPDPIGGLRSRRLQARVRRGALRRRRARSARRFDHVGPLARTVADAAAMFHVLARSAPRPPVVRKAATLRLGRLRGYFEARLEPAVSAALRSRARVDRERRRGAVGRDLAARPGHRGHLSGNRARRSVRVPRGDAAAMPGAVLASRPHPARDGPIHPRGRLPSRAGGSGGSQARGRPGPGRRRRAGAARHADCRAAAGRRDDRHRWRSPSPCGR